MASRLASRGIGIVLAAVVAIAAVAYLASSDEFPPQLVAGGDERKEQPATDGEGQGSRADGNGNRDASPLEGASEVPGDVWDAVRAPLAALLLGALGLLGSRTIARRRRRYVRLRLLPYRADEAEPADVDRMIEAWHQQLLERWWRRVPFGQPSIALEFATAPGAEGDREVVLSIVCPEELIDAIEGSLLGCYPDATLIRDGNRLPEVSRVIRLKKRHTLVRALRTSDKDEPNLVDSLLNQMASLEQNAVVQYALVPTPAVFDRFVRWRFASEERAQEAARSEDLANPGLRSEVLKEELVGGLRVQHQPLFFAELRCAAQTYRGARALAGSIRGASGAENRLTENYIRPFPRGGLYLARIRDGLANPLPPWRKGVISSLELAGLWQLPSPGLRRVQLARSPVPRMPATPEVSRDPGHQLMRDERGPVGIRPEDKSDGLGLIGGQKTGKTSVLCRTVQADALDPDCALVVLMPKPGDARKALSMVPPGRTVHFLDLENPEFGINPLRADGDPAMVADKIVDAFRDVNQEGDIRGSSDRYLRQAAQAAIGASRAGVVDGPPNLWHMYRILIPVEKEFRERVVQALYPDPSFTDTATFFGRELPNDLESAPGQTAAKLDAPRNKILRLLVESLDKVLRHPIQLSLDEVVRKREVLVVDGKMGTFGADNTRVMMQFILTSLYGALRRQQELPEEQRVRVGLKVDEAHLILNESFADAMATLRSGGLEVTAAWQYGEQIQDPKVRSGMMSLLRQRCMFSMGEERDAREMSSIGMAVYADMIRADPESRSRYRLTPDTIFNLPNYHAICSWISRGARVPAFLAQTLPLELDEDAVRHHLDEQRRRGCHVPDRLPDPLPDLEFTGLGDLPSGEIPGGDGAPRAPVAGGTAPAPPGDQVGARRQRRTGGRRSSLPAPALGGGASSESPRSPARGAPRLVKRRVRRVPKDAKPPAAKPAAAKPSAPKPPPKQPVAAAVALDFNPGATSIDDSNGGQVRALPTQGAPDTYTELDLDDVRGLVWDKVTPLPADRRHEPSNRELQILGALWSYRVLFASQIWRRWWSGSSLRAAQQTLNKMTKAGWVRRFKFQLGERGAQQRVYCLTRLGFELAQERIGRHGNHIDPEATWREPVLTDPRRILRDLHVNGWVLAFDKRAGKIVAGWRGPRESRLNPPRKRNRGEWLDIDPREILIGSSHKLRDYEPHKFEPVSPDATLELRIPAGESAMRFDLLIELDRARSAAASEERLRRYDGLIAGWAGMLERYKTMGTPPMVVFVCEDEKELGKLIRIADRAVTARLAKPGTPETEWPHPGRRGIFFAVEREIHFGSLEAFQLPELPPELRVRMNGRRARACRPRRVNLIEPKLIDFGSDIAPLPVDV